MAIAVVCPGCKKSFRVSDKFAGKQGPCPHCKATITVPAASEEVKIHAPEEQAAAGKDSTGRPTARPLRRQEMKLSAVQVVSLVGSCLLVLVAARLLRTPLNNSELLRALSLLIVSGPLVLAGYAGMRDAELEPYRGWRLWVRVASCAAVYAGLWIGFHFIPQDYAAEIWQWFFIAPPFLFVGALAALVCLDLELGNGFSHYCFYLLVTLLLAYLAQVGPFLNAA